MFQVIAAITALLSLHARQIEAQSVLATDCWFKSSSSVRFTGNANPCGVVTPATTFISCCVVGDTCLQDGICHYTHPMPDPPTNETGYYIGGCTDKTFSAPACPPQCSDLSFPDVTYDEAEGIWHCCGTTNGSVRCDIPTDETFSAPALSLLSNTFTVGATPTTGAAPSSTSSTTTTTTPAASGPSTTPSGTANSGLSGGAKAGIGIGVAVVALAGLGVLIWFCARRRNMHAMEKQSQEVPFMGYPQGYSQKTEVPVELTEREPYQKIQAPVELAEREPNPKRDTVRAELG